MIAIVIVIIIVSIIALVSTLFIPIEDPKKGSPSSKENSIDCPDAPECIDCSPCISPTCPDSPGVCSPDANHPNCERFFPPDCPPECPPGDVNAPNCRPFITSPNCERFFPPDCPPECSPGVSGPNCNPFITSPACERFFPPDCPPECSPGVCPPGDVNAPNCRPFITSPNCERFFPPDCPPECSPGVCPPGDVNAPNCRPFITSPNCERFFPPDCPPECSPGVSGPNCNPFITSPACERFFPPECPPECSPGVSGPNCRPFITSPNCERFFPPDCPPECSPGVSGPNCNPFITSPACERFFPPDCPPECPPGVSGPNCNPFITSPACERFFPPDCPPECPPECSPGVSGPNCNPFITSPACERFFPPDCPPECPPECPPGVSGPNCNPFITSPACERFFPPDCPPECPPECPPGVSGPNCNPFVTSPACERFFPPDCPPECPPGVSGPNCEPFICDEPYLCTELGEIISNPPGTALYNSIRNFSPPPGSVSFPVIKFISDPGVNPATIGSFNEPDCILKRKVSSVWKKGSIYFYIYMNRDKTFTDSPAATWTTEVPNSSIPNFSAGASSSNLVHSPDNNKIFIKNGIIFQFLISVRPDDSIIFSDRHIEGIYQELQNSNSSLITNSILFTDTVFEERLNIDDMCSELGLCPPGVSGPNCNPFVTSPACERFFPPECPPECSPVVDCLIDCTTDTLSTFTEKGQKINDTSSGVYNSVRYVSPLYTCPRIKINFLNFNTGVGVAVTEDETKMKFSSIWHKEWANTYLYVYMDRNGNFDGSILLESSLIPQIGGSSPTISSFITLDYDDSKVIDGNNIFFKHPGGSDAWVTAISRRPDNSLILMSTDNWPITTGNDKQYGEIQNSNNSINGARPTKFITCLSCVENECGRLVNTPICEMFCSPPDANHPNCERFFPNCSPEANHPNCIEYFPPECPPECSPVVDCLIDCTTDTLSTFTEKGQKINDTSSGVYNSVRYVSPLYTCPRKKINFLNFNTGNGEAVTEDETKMKFSSIWHKEWANTYLYVYMDRNGNFDGSILLESSLIPQIGGGSIPSSAITLDYDDSKVIDGNNIFFKHPGGSDAWVTAISRRPDNSLILMSTDNWPITTGNDKQYGEIQNSNNSINGARPTKFITCLSCVENECGRLVNTPICEMFCSPDANHPNCERLFPDCSPEANHPNCERFFPDCSPDANHPNCEPFICDEPYLCTELGEKIVETPFVDGISTPYNSVRNYSPPLMIDLSSGLEIKQDIIKFFLRINIPVDTITTKMKKDISSVWETPEPFAKFYYFYMNKDGTFNGNIPLRRSDDAPITYGSGTDHDWITYSPLISPLNINYSDTFKYTLFRDPGSRPGSGTVDRKYCISLRPDNSLIFSIEMSSIIHTEVQNSNNSLNISNIFKGRYRDFEKVNAPNCQPFITSPNCERFFPDCSPGVSGPNCQPFICDVPYLCTELGEKIVNTPFVDGISTPYNSIRNYSPPLMIDPSGLEIKQDGIIYFILDNSDNDSLNIEIKKKFSSIWRDPGRHLYIYMNRDKTFNSSEPLVYTDQAPSRYKSGETFSTGIATHKGLLESSDVLYSIEKKRIIFQAPTAWPTGMALSFMISERPDNSLIMAKEFTSSSSTVRYKELQNSNNSIDGDLRDQFIVRLNDFEDFVTSPNCEYLFSPECSPGVNAPICDQSYMCTIFNTPITATEINMFNVITIPLFEPVNNGTRKVSPPKSTDSSSNGMDGTTPIYIQINPLSSQFNSMNLPDISPAASFVSVEDIDFLKKIASTWKVSSDSGDFIRYESFFLDAGGNFDKNTVHVTYHNLNSRERGDADLISSINVISNRTSEINTVNFTKQIFFKNISLNEWDNGIQLCQDDSIVVLKGTFTDSKILFELQNSNNSLKNNPIDPSSKVWTCVRRLEENNSFEPCKTSSLCTRILQKPLLNALELNDSARQTSPDVTLGDNSGVRIIIFPTVFSGNSDPHPTETINLNSDNINFLRSMSSSWYVRNSTTNDDENQLLTVFQDSNGQFNPEGGLKIWGGSFLSNFQDSRFETQHMNCTSGMSSCGPGMVANGINYSTTQGGIIKDDALGQLAIYFSSAAETYKYVVGRLNDLSIVLYEREGTTDNFKELQNSKNTIKQPTTPLYKCIRVLNTNRIKSLIPTSGPAAAGSFYPWDLGGKFCTFSEKFAHGQEYSWRLTTNFEIISWALPIIGEPDIGLEISIGGVPMPPLYGGHRVIMLTDVGMKTVPIICGDVPSMDTAPLFTNDFHTNPILNTYMELPININDIALMFKYNCSSVWKVERDYNGAGISEIMINTEMGSDMYEQTSEEYVSFFMNYDGDFDPAAGFKIVRAGTGSEPKWVQKFSSSMQPLVGNAVAIDRVTKGILFSVQDGISIDSRVYKLLLNINNPYFYWTFLLTLDSCNRLTLYQNSHWQLHPDNNGNLLKWIELQNEENTLLSSQRNSTGQGARTGLTTFTNLLDRKETWTFEERAKNNLF